jgi:leucyl/phenylalanyl-tRNA---protein transferase
LQIRWLEGDDPFPPLTHASRGPHGPDGLLAAGGDLSSRRLIDAYRQGIFPWYSAGDPILWWSPEPRMVLFPSEFRCSRSLTKRLRSNTFVVRTDTAFADVITRCAQASRPGQDGTWIQPEMIAAYIELHRLGYAHSVETWQDDVLVGGLYGLHLGHVFFGESMFAHASDASKVALAHLVQRLLTMRVEMIDCQQQTSHLASMGARPIARADFRQRLDQLIESKPSPVSWRAVLTS